MDADTLARLKQDRQRSDFYSNGDGPWTILYYSAHATDENVGYFAALIPEALRAHAMDGDQWDLTIGNGGPGFTQYYDEGDVRAQYHRLGDDSGIEPIVLTQSHYEVRPKMLPQLCEEFRLYHNLWLSPDGSKLYKVPDDGNDYLAAEISHDRVRVRTKLLRQYQAGRQLHLLQYIDSIQYVTDEDPGFDLAALAEELIEERIHLTFYAGDRVKGPRRPFSRLLGKKLYLAPPREKAGVWPYDDEPDNYRDFIIDEDEFGDPVRHTCDPDQLANYFGKNPHAPHYLTPVFFKREVLQRYYEQPEKFTVSDGRLSCGYLWGVQIDNDLKHHVMVFLGDLGRDLPEAERDYWGAFNVVPTSGMSETVVRRSFLAQPTDPMSPDLQFKRTYSRFNDKFSSRFGWALFREPMPADRHVFQRLRMPLTASQPEFEDQLFGLTKVLVDFLNEGEISRQLASKVEGEKGIDKFQRWMVKAGYANASRDTALLKRLQKLRSKVAAHRKGSDYEQLLQDEDVESDPTLEMSKQFVAAHVMLAELAEHLGLEGFPLPDA